MNNVRGENLNILVFLVLFLVFLVEPIDLSGEEAVITRLTKKGVAKKFAIHTSHVALNSKHCTKKGNL